MRKRFRWLLALLFTLACCLTSYADWVVFENTSIAGKITGSIKKGYILETASGNVYQVTDYVYLYEYEYYPKVLVLRDGDRFKLIIDGIDEPLICKCLNCQTSASEDDKQKANADIIESYIVNDFDGLDYGNIYKLANGQVWQQVDAWIWIWIWVYPKVTIWREGSFYKMKIEKIDHAVIVERLK